MVLLGFLLAFVVVAAVLSSGAVGVFACRGVYSSLTGHLGSVDVPQARVVGNARWNAIAIESRGIGRALLRATAACVAAVVGVAAAYAWGVLCVVVLSAVV